MIWIYDFLPTLAIFCLIMKKNKLKTATGGQNDAMHKLLK